MEENGFKSKHSAYDIACAVYNELVLIGDKINITPIANIPLFGYARDKSVERMGLGKTSDYRTYMKYWHLERTMPEYTDLLIYDLKKRNAVSVDVLTSLDNLRQYDRGQFAPYESDSLFRDSVIISTVNNPNIRSSYIAIPKEIEREAIAALKDTRFGFRRSLYGSCGIIRYDEDLNMRIIKKAGRKPVTKFSSDDERKLLALHLDRIDTMLHTTRDSNF